jgi:hypothetical protein
VPPTDRSQRAPKPRSALAGLSADPGLCARCRHLELLSSPRSTFVRCGLAESDPSFPRYPRLPVLHCAGFAPGAGGGET